MVGHVDLISLREQSHCHQASQPCLLGLLFIFFTLFYLVSACVFIPTHARTRTYTPTHTVSTYICHRIHVAMREQLSGLVLFPGFWDLQGQKAGTFAVSLAHHLIF